MLELYAFACVGCLRVCLCARVCWLCGRLFDVFVFVLCVRDYLCVRAWACVRVFACLWFLFVCMCTCASVSLLVGLHVCLYVWLCVDVCVCLMY